MVDISFITRISTALTSLFRQPSPDDSLTSAVSPLRRPDSTLFSQHTFKQYRDERGAITNFEYDTQGRLVCRYTSWLHPQTGCVEISNLAMLV